MKLLTRVPSRTSRRRTGFTLVELMVVVAIIAVIISLGASATMQVITRQRTTNTELTIQKVNDALKAHWQAVIQQAKTEPIPDNILYGPHGGTGLFVLASLTADGNPPIPDSDAMRRARVIWIKLRLKQQFPMNFMEALNPAPTEGADRILFQLPPAPCFVQALLGRPTVPWPLGQLPPPSLANNPPQSFESSVLLLIALTQARSGVVSLDQDRLSSAEKADSGVNGLKMIVDAWGRPLTFYRWPIGGEVAASNPNKTASQAIGDPLDPDGLLTSPLWMNYPNSGGPIRFFETLCHPVHDVDAGLTPATYRPRSYYTVPVVASAGPAIGAKLPNQPYLSVYDLMGLPQPKGYDSATASLPAPLRHDPMKIAPGSTPLSWPNPTADALDNLYSFRMRLGARGD